MFQINNAELADGAGAINYPMEQGTKRRYTLSIESSGYSSNLQLARPTRASHPTQ